MKILKRIYNKINKRKKYLNSYVIKKLGNKNNIKRKIMEEAFEFVNELKKEYNKKNIIHEFCDLLFHSLLLLSITNIKLKEIKKEFKKRL